MTALRGKGRDQVPAGSVLVVETPGGGGIGDVKRREPERVRLDPEAGLVSAAMARCLYGVEPL